MRQLRISKIVRMYICIVEREISDAGLFIFYTIVFQELSLLYTDVI